VLPDAAIRLIAVFVPKVRAIEGQLGWRYALSTDAARDVFGWAPRPYEQTLVDMGESLIAQRLV
jgi:nucleoside-diphosphate-sugar epimerase